MREIHGSVRETAPHASADDYEATLMREATKLAASVDERNMLTVYGDAWAGNSSRHEGMRTDRSSHSIGDVSVG